MNQVFDGRCCAVLKGESGSCSNEWGRISCPARVVLATGLDTRGEECLNRRVVDRHARNHRRSPRAGQGVAGSGGVIREMPAGLLVGRERELQVIAGLLFGVRESGATLIVRGDAGIGKSALLAAARRTATNNGMLVLRRKVLGRPPLAAYASNARAVADLPAALSPADRPLVFVIGAGVSRAIWLLRAFCGTRSTANAPVAVEVAPGQHFAVSSIKSVFAATVRRLHVSTPR